MKFKSHSQRKAVMAKLNKKYYLVDIKRKIYSPKAGYDTEKRAIQGNLVVQLSSGNDFIIPLKKEVIIKQKIKPGKIDIYQPTK